jgi:hypothetical protein
MYLPDLPQTSRTLAIFNNSSCIPNLEIEEGIVCPFIEIPSSKEKPLSNLTTKFRKKLEKSLKKIEAEQGRIELKQYLDIGSFEQAMQIFFSLYTKNDGLQKVN